MNKDDTKRLVSSLCDAARRAGITRSSGVNIRVAMIPAGELVAAADAIAHYCASHRNAIEERDEARRLYCEAVAAIEARDLHIPVSGLASALAAISRSQMTKREAARAVAKRLGWYCFPEGNSDA